MSANQAAPPVAPSTAAGAGSATAMSAASSETFVAAWRLRSPTTWILIEAPSITPHVLGRRLLGAEFLSVSRAQCSLTADGVGGLTIEQSGTNASAIRPHHTANWLLLRTGERRQLKHGDLLALEGQTRRDASTFEVEAVRQPLATLPAARRLASSPAAPQAGSPGKRLAWDRDLFASASARGGGPRSMLDAFDEGMLEAQLGDVAMMPPAAASRAAPPAATETIELVSDEDDDEDDAPSAGRERSGPPKDERAADVARRITCGLYVIAGQSCQHDGRCYQRGVAHFLEYAHPCEAGKPYCPALLRASSGLNPTALRLIALRCASHCLLTDVPHIDDLPRRRWRPMLQQGSCVYFPQRDLFPRPSPELPRGCPTSYGHRQLGGVEQLGGTRL
jgi:hypothetical protein